MRAPLAQHGATIRKPAVHIVVAQLETARATLVRHERVKVVVCWVVFQIAKAPREAGIFAHRSIRVLTAEDFAFRVREQKFPLRWRWRSDSHTHKSSSRLFPTERFYYNLRIPTTCVGTGGELPGGTRGR